MTGNEAAPVPTARPIPTSSGGTSQARAARSSTPPASAEGQDGDAPEVVGELLFATVEAYEGVQTLHARLRTLQSEPFDLAAASAVVELLSSARWQRARSSWQVLQRAQVWTDAKVAGADDEADDSRVSTIDVASSTTLQTVGDFGAVPRGTQRVSDLLLELGTVYGWSGFRHIATHRGRITGIGGQPC